MRADVGGEEREREKDEGVKVWRATQGHVGGGGSGHRWSTACSQTAQRAGGCGVSNGLYPDFFDTGSDEGLPGVLRRHAPPVLRRIKGSGPQALQQSGDSKLTYFG